MLHYLLHNCQMTTVTPNSYTPKRMSLPLSAQDQLDLALIRDSIEHASILTDEPQPGRMSDAALIHAVFEIGLRHAREEADAAGYAALASDPEWIANQAAQRANRRTTGVLADPASLDEGAREA
jgi:hypothetical protein